MSDPVFSPLLTSVAISFSRFLLELTVFFLSFCSGVVGLEEGLMELLISGLSIHAKNDAGTST